MFDIQFYKDKNGKSEIIDYLDDLQVKAQTSKDAKMQRCKDKQREDSDLLKGT